MGESVGLVLPPEVLKKLRVVSGDHVSLSDTAEGIELKRLDPSMAEQLAAADQVIREDDEALRRLAE